MSLTAFKNKSIIQYGTKRSGIPPGGVWLPQGPFGHATSVLKKATQSYGPVGFSINGGHRNVGRVGQDMKMSKSGTPFRGVNPIGWGGSFGKYPTPHPLLNVLEVDTLGTQYRYIKPSTLSTYGMLQKRYKWAYYGQYPNYWVQPNYTGNQTDTASQQMYIHTKTSANTCALKVNNAGMYVNYIANQGPTLCATTPARLKYNDLVRNGRYTKILHQPVPSSTYTQYVQRGCQNPVGPQKPFPYRVTSGSSYSAAGTSITSFGASCNANNTIKMAPPDWYTRMRPGEKMHIADSIPQFIPFTIK